MTHRFIPVLLIVFFIALFSIVQAGDQMWQRIAGLNFVIYYQDDDLKNSQKILTLLQSSYLQLSQELDINLVDSVFIFITPSQQAFDQIVGKNIPKWTDGLAAPMNHTIILKSPKWNTPDMDINSIAIHELVHIMLDRATKGNPIPRWFNEGLAVYYSGEKSYASSTLISKALVTNSLIPLSDIDDVLSFHRDKAQLAYQQSYLAVSYLFRNYGSEAIKAIIHQLGEGNNLNQSFINVMDLDSWEFEEAWLQYIKKQYRWHFLVEFDNYLWILILGLFILGFILIRLRNRRTIRQWQENEENLID